MTSETPVTSLGVVREWHDDDGWGVVDADPTPGGAWAHCSCVLVAGHRTLRVGEAVTFTWEVAEQDGYSFRVVEVWPSALQPVRGDEVDVHASAAFRSELRLTFDDE